MDCAGMADLFFKCVRGVIGRQNLDGAIVKAAHTASCLLGF